MSYSFYKRLEKFKIILGSQSPRRAQLLSDLGLNFAIEVRPVDESVPVKLKGGKAAVCIAEMKWNSFKKECALKNQLVITADTIVSLNNELIGKPLDDDDAFQMLRKLSGKVHEVYTGVRIGNSFYAESFAVKTEVLFKQMSEEEITYYIKEFKPFDKAGAYGAQDWIGLTAVEKINGSFFNVMGLPVKEVYESLIRCCDKLLK
ncbi:MAG: septum formation protein Maf [Bacteroidia bacterium]|nr:septum formation protein Maf [Bacteroidia bacterium]